VLLKSDDVDEYEKWVMTEGKAWLLCSFPTSGPSI
jgi:hypothetical protein